MRNRITVPAALAFAAAVPFLAPTIAAGQDATPPTIPADWLGAGDIANLLPEGWTLAKIEVELNDGNYEACLVGADGSQVKVRIDPLTGEILSEQAEACLDDDEDSSGDDPSGDSKSDDPSGDSGSDDPSGDSGSDDPSGDSSSDDSPDEDSEDDDSSDDDSDDDSSDDDDSDDDDDPSGSAA